jgi:hypothetical protein
MNSCLINLNQTQLRIHAKLKSCLAAMSNIPLQLANTKLSTSRDDPHTALGLVWRVFLIKKIGGGIYLLKSSYIACSSSKPITHWTLLLVGPKPITLELCVAFHLFLLHCLFPMLSLSHALMSMIYGHLANVQLNSTLVTKKTKIIEPIGNIVLN